MAVQLKETTRNARLDAIETALGASPILELRSGAQPANADAADSGTLLCTMTLPADAFAAAAAGAKAKSGTWQGTASGGGGTIGHFRLKTSGAATIVQGDVGLGSGSMSLDNNVVADGQTITVTSFTLTDGNA